VLRTELDGLYESLQKSPEDLNNYIHKLKELAEETAKELEQAKHHPELTKYALDNVFLKLCQIALIFYQLEAFETTQSSEVKE